MRTAAIDIGSNSTRLLIADVVDGRLSELHRQSIVTRLGDGVDASGRLTTAARERVVTALAEYAERIAASGCQRAAAVATSAVREAADGEAFARELSERFALPVSVIDGDQEAGLTFRGAASGGVLGDARTLVVDVGGGSTELVVGSGGQPQFNVSTRLGCVRQSERHLGDDPPTDAQLTALIDEAVATIERSVPAQWRERPEQVVAVAGTPTSLAAIDLELERFDSNRVHDHRMSAATCERLLARLAALPLAERTEVVGLHPDRAPTIVAGAAILVAALRAFDAPELVVSEHDLLYGLSLSLADER